MVIRAVKYIFYIAMAATLMGCPGNEDCNDIEAAARHDGLITLLPLQDHYTPGDVVTYKITIPSNNNFFYTTGLDLYDATEDSHAQLISSTALFEGNQLTFISGEQGQESNWFNLIYNSTTDAYELEIRVKLNRTGNYIVPSGEYIWFQGRETCNRYRLDTSIAGADESYNVAFTVD